MIDPLPGLAAILAPVIQCAYMEHDKNWNNFSAVVKIKREISNQKSRGKKKKKKIRSKKEKKKKTA